MATAVLALLLGIIVVFLITVVTGYFVAQEFAFMAVDRSRLAARAEAGDTGARRALKVTARTSFMLSGAQLGITVTGLLVGYVAEPLIGQSLGTILDDVGLTLELGLALGAIVALLFSTVIQMVFGELFPKNLAIARSDVGAIRLARSTTIYLALFGWLIWVFDQASNLLLRLVRITPVHDVEHAASDRDLEHIVADSRESGHLPAELSMMIDRIIDFPRRNVEHAMIPRTKADTVSETDTIGDVRRIMSTGHSRYPVLASDGEDIVGIVQLVDVLFTSLPQDRPVSELLRPALVVPQLMSLPNALTELSATKNQLACVVDEYGGFAGVLTLEDLAEELVGEITDEHDPIEADDASIVAEGVWRMAGDVHVDEAERTIGVDLPRGDYETIAGMLIAHFGRLPEVGTTITMRLDPDPEDLVKHDEPLIRVIEAQVLAVERYVPSDVQLSLSGLEPATETDIAAAGGAHE